MQALKTTRKGLLTIGIGLFLVFTLSMSSLASNRDYLTTPEELTEIKSKTDSLNPTDDSYVRGGNYEEETFDEDKFQLHVKEAKGVDNDCHTYLKFDLSSISDSVFSAILKIYIRDISNKGTEGEVFIYPAVDSWTETDIAWNIAPAANTGNVLIDQDNITAGRYFNFSSTSLTDYVSQEASGDKTVTFAMYGKDATGLLMNDREHSNPPVLTVVTSDGGGAAQYTLAVNRSGSGSVTLDPSGGIYDEGTVVTITVDPDSAWQFDNWGGDLSGSANIETITMDSNKNVIALLSLIQYTLAVNTSGDGSVTLDPTGGPSAGVFYENTVVTLTAIKALDYPFGSWSGDLSGSDNPATMTMDADKNVTANFIYTPEPRILTVTTTGKGSVSLDPPGGSYTDGTIVTMTANADSGYEFVEWSEDLSGSGSPVTITMDTHKSVTAQFTGIIKIALWGDSRENEHNATSHICSILSNDVTDWDFTLHNGDITPGGSDANWSKALGYPGMSEIFNSGKFYMCTSNHDDKAGPYNSHTAGVLPTNSANGSTHFYHFQQGNVHVFACDQQFTPAAVMQDWLDAELATIDPNDWIIGFWHDPCYSDLTYKSSNLSKCGGWLDALYRHGGDFIFHGHAHVYVRTHPLLPNEDVDPSGMVHIVNGCGGASWKSAPPQTIHTAFAPNTDSFAAITFLTFDGNSVDIETVDARPGKNLAVIDSWSWTRDPFVPTGITTRQPLTIPVQYSLTNYPNPFNPSTIIQFTLPEAGRVNLTVYDIHGRTVATLLNSHLDAGSYTHVWDSKSTTGHQLSSGVYLCRIQSGSNVKTIKMMFIR